MKSFVFGLFLLIALMGACASYHFGNWGRALPGGYDRVAVPMFVNKTQEVGIEAYFTKALRTEFERSRLAKVVSKNDAQLILEGTITNLTFVPTVLINSTSNQLVSVSPIPTPTPGPTATPGATPNPNPLPNTAVLSKQYAVSLNVHLEAHKASDNSIIWQSDFQASRQYDAPLLGTATLNGVPGINSQAPLYNESSRQSTIAALAKDMMAEAHDRLTENF